MNVYPVSLKLPVSVPSGVIGLGTIDGSQPPTTSYRIGPSEPVERGRSGIPSGTVVLGREP